MYVVCQKIVHVCGYFMYIARTYPGFYRQRVVTSFVIRRFVYFFSDTTFLTDFCHFSSHCLSQEVIKPRIQVQLAHLKVEQKNEICINLLFVLDFIVLGPILEFLIIIIYNEIDKEISFLESSNNRDTTF